MVDRKHTLYFIFGIICPIIFGAMLVYWVLSVGMNVLCTAPHAPQDSMAQDTRDRERGKTLALHESKTWPWYRNDTLGIAFQYPLHVYSGDLGFFQAGNIVFVTATSSDVYAHRRELARYRNDETILAKAKAIQDKSPDGWQGYWGIWVRDARNDADLSRFMDAYLGKYYWKGCVLGKKTISTQPGVYDVDIVAARPSSNGSSDADSSCFINWMMAFKYSSYYGRAALWDIGQEPVFFLASERSGSVAFEDSYIADFIMVDSFRFIPKK